MFVILSKPSLLLQAKEQKDNLDLDAMLLLQELGQHWQMAQAAEPKQQAAVLPSEMMAPMVELETGALGRTDLEMEILYESTNKLPTSLLQTGFKEVTLFTVMW